MRRFEVLEDRALLATLGPWSLQEKVYADDPVAGDRMGSDVTLDGDTIIAGSVLNDQAGVDAGALYIFERTGSTWDQQAKLLASDA
ncbi:MAG: FG-GAP repeat protein, partial [Planctomycetota bacterium]